VLLAVVAFLLLAVVAARGISGVPRDPRPTQQGVTPPNLPGQDTGVPDLSFEPMAYTAGVLIVLVTVAVLFGLALFLVALAGIRIRGRRRMIGPEVLGDQQDLPPGESWLQGASRRALSELDSRVGGPPSDAVIAAWVELEQAAASGGTPRQPHQTPSEFTESVLTEHAADATALTELRALYHRARFGAGIAPEDAAAARRALERIALEAR
jgi:hypothetical protein